MIRRYFIITEKKRPKNWLEKMPPPKDFLLILFGSIITFAVSSITTGFDDAKQQRKEFFQRKDLYATNYIKELNQRFMLFTDLVQKDGYINQSKNDSLNIRNNAEKLEEARIIWNTNDLYDQIQFHRYFGNRYDEKLSRINSLINEDAQFAEANDKRYQDKLVIEQGKILDLINDFEKSVYTDIDKKSN
jgi:hypothetical protein